MLVSHRYTLVILLLLSLACAALAGGGPQNILIVVNSHSKESLEVGNWYRRAREVPYRQLLTIPMSTTPSVSYQSYLDEIEGPIRGYLHDQQLEDAVTCIVLTRGVPIQVDVQNGRSVASLLAGMNAGKGAGRVPNPYLNGATAFSHDRDNLKGLYLVTALNGYHVQDIRTLITQGKMGDGTAPDGRFIFQSVPQLPRAGNTAAVDLLALRGLHAELADTPPADRNDLMGYFSGGIFSGITRDILTASTFRPGAIVDYAQGYGATAKNFDESNTPVLLPAGAFVQAGAAGVHGVVGEAGLSSFPMVANLKTLLDRYTSGFSLAESFYAALPALKWQNVILGDPLTTPYAKRPYVNFEMEQQGPLAGMVPLRITAISQTRGIPVQRIDLYLDDRFVQTLYQPQACQINLRIGERLVQYTAPTGVSLQGLLQGLADAVNGDATLSGPNGVKATPQLETGALQLTARTTDSMAGTLPVTVNIDAPANQQAPVTATVQPAEVGGGDGPIPARGTVSFIGRRVKTGDQIALRIQDETITYVVPEGITTLSALIDEMVTRIQASRTLQRWSGVRAYRDPAGMPYITLEARTTGETGNQIPYQLTVTPVEGSQIRGYPTTLSRLTGGQNGSTTRFGVRFSLGDPSAAIPYQLDTTALCDGVHHLRAVAYDASPAQVQGYAIREFTVRNDEKAPVVSLPEKFGTVTATLDAPVTANEQVARVELYLDGRLCGSSADAPFVVHASLADTGRGPHDLRVVGYTAAGKQYISPSTVIEVLTPPEIFRIDPGFGVKAGGTTHRIIGAGFQAGCTVRLNGKPVKTVTMRSPNLLEVVSGEGTVGRDAVEVVNPDTLQASLPDTFEYYEPRLAGAEILPAQDVIRPGGAVQFTARVLDQFKQPMAGKVTWDTIGGGNINGTGLYQAPTDLGRGYLVRATSPNGKELARAQVVIGSEELPKGGWLRQWLILGGFPDPDYTGLTTPLIEEPTIEPSHGDKAGELPWRSLYAERNYVDLATACALNTNAVAYGHVYLYAPATTACTLTFGANDGIRIWLNGEMVFTQHISHSAVDPDQNSTNITLNAGWNRLLVKVDQESGGWGFYMRLLAKGGKPLNDITFALDKPAEEKEAAPAPVPAPAQAPEQKD